MHFGTNLPAGRFGGRTAHAPAILQDGGAQGEDGRTDTGTPVNKRETYDRHGKAGFSGPESSGSNSRYQGFTYTFRSPEEVFREFFGSRDPFSDFFGPGLVSDEMRHTHSSPFFTDIFPGSRVYSSFSSFGNSGLTGNVSSVSTTTTITNGKKITTRRIVENGVEREEVEEDGQLKSIRVNGVEDELALAIEISKRDQKSEPAPSRSQTREPPDNVRRAPPTCLVLDSDDEDEDLQLAMAYSLSEMEAAGQHRAGVRSKARAKRQQRGQRSEEPPSHQQGAEHPNEHKRHQAKVIRPQRDESEEQAGHKEEVKESGRGEGDPKNNEEKKKRRCFIL
ncbi:dnaJ homolog subfamily B member 2 isoform X1 [Ranitomeya imitator]|uniref:dnaJ homolog subfamily B member 2 isoform X1 n=1 Tax=Ranitomeya imitator TaxID=111125 RepID=UPI0037E745A8